MIEIKIHLVHGSIKKKSDSRNSKRIFGLLGGHALIEIDNWVYGFTYTERKIKLFPNPLKSIGVLNKVTSNAFEKETFWERKTTYRIKVKKSSYSELKFWLNIYNEKCPFDYAVFGERCCSFHFKLISKIGITKENYLIKIISQLPTLYIYFFKFLLQPNLNLNSTINKGCTSRYWI